MGKWGAARASSSMMLTGRESLIRLVGKRRRILPNYHSLFSPRSNPPKVDSILPKEEAPQGQGSSSNASAGETPGLDRVTCPVCGTSVRGTDYALNTHLDSCLARGTKRKLTQSTLFQFKFCSKSSKVDISPGEPINFGADAMQNRVDDNNMQNGNCVLHKLDTVADDPPLSAQSIPEAHEEVLAENLDEQNIVIKEEVETPNFVMCEVDRGNFVEDSKINILETFIVGHRFREVKLSHGDKFFLLRDPNNVKDPNAIKVLSVDSGCPKLLGFLPRELAKCLSPLIDKFNFNFEGRVTSFPEHSVGNVPVQIFCQEMTSYAEKESSDHKDFELLWHSVLKVVEYNKVFSPSMTKYQQNFHLLIQEVMRNHCHLFTDDERFFIESFNSLSEDSQRLFVRLYTRKGPWFRMSNISYPEVLNCQQAIQGLCAAGYVCSLESMEECDYDLKEVLNVLYVSELREILSDIHLKLQKGTHSARKEEMMGSLLASYNDRKCPSLHHLILNRGAYVRISANAEFLLWRIQRLFFLNGEQDLSAFLMVDLGLVKYPDYKCIRSNQIFPSQCDLMSYEQAIEVAQVMDQSLDESNNEMVLRCIEISNDYISSSSAGVTQSSSYDSVGPFLSLFSASYVYSIVVTLGISYFERERRYEDATRLLQLLLRRIVSDGRRGYWTLRLSVDLEHIFRLDESLSVAEEGLLDPWVRAGSKMALQRRVLRLGKPPRRWKTPSFSESVKRKIREVRVLGRPLNCDLGLKNRFYGDDGEQCGVEQLALQYYAGEGGGWQGVHAESGIWMTIFGILMWDVIFADMPDVFHTRFQTAPLDLETDNFYIARKSIIECQLDKIHSGMAEEILICSWESHVGISCRGVNWDKHSLSDLRAAVTCVGGPCLASLCRLLAQDYRSWSRGMPDLFLWRFLDEYIGEAKLVEVKGPRDRLSEQQRAWLLLLMDCGFTTEDVVGCSMQSQLYREYWTNHCR